MRKKGMKLGFLLLMAIIMIFPFSVFAESGDVYVIPIKGEITSATATFVRDSIKEVEVKNPEAIVFEIDTYGGRVDSAELIKNYILNTNAKTVSFINNNAQSAGVLISISSENIIMTNSSTIGSAETIPNEEKILSMWRSMLRNTAQTRGRDSLLIEAMADSSIEIPGITEKGKLVNLTSEEALEYGIADVVDNKLESGLDQLGINYSNIVEVEETLATKLASFVSSQGVSSFLLSLAFVAFIVELFVPGFGIPGIISVISFALFFAGNLFAGYSSWMSILFFVIGIILLFIELMVPGFGLPGISGIILLFAGIVTAMDSLTSAVYAVSVALVASAIAIVILLKLGRKMKVFDRLALNVTSSAEKGYISNDAGKLKVGDRGVAPTDLRPSGFGYFDGEKSDVLAVSNYIVKHTEIEISSIEGAKIFVKEIVK
ncbi:MAG: nodulation protein NfeD [Tissierellia bacterium]|nr:nodulation protein NfeD [Tissierellia bacterium]